MPNVVAAGQGNADQQGMWRSIIDGLRAKPAYLLVFAICAVFFLTGILSAVSAVINKGEFRYFLFTGVCFALALIGAIVVVRMVDGSTNAPQPPPQPQHPLLHLITGQPGIKSELADAIVAVAENVVGALSLNYDVLAQTVLDKLADFRAISGDWKRGQLVAAGPAYNRLLKQVYENAKDNVFATAVPEYHNAVWQSRLGSELMEAHSRSHARVTRVFLFNKRTEVEPPMVATMQTQSARGIEVRLFFDDEDVFQFSPDTARDFTVIDEGEIIAVTESFNPEQPQARWYFGDSDRQARFQKLREDLVRGSISLGQFEAWWKERA